MNLKNVAIVCQGGGSHTAFTAGVLRVLLERMARQEQYRLIGLSGTSGGAICALLAWYGLLRVTRDLEPVEQVGERLEAFWYDNATSSPWEQSWNAWLVNLLRMEGNGLLPSLNVSPYNTEWLRRMSQPWTSMLTRREFFDFRALLQKHIQFEDVPSLMQPESPRLLLGAVDVIDGTFKAFDSLANEIHIDALLASVSIPVLFKAAKVGENYYWDGLFSQNPPIQEFLMNVPEGQPRPDEFWVVRINPNQRLPPTEPTSIGDILDRRNELAGNLSLEQEKRFVESWNILKGKIKDKEESNPNLAAELQELADVQYVEWREIEKTPALSEQLDYASKLDRDRDHIDTLIQDGKKRAEQFWQQL